MDWAYVGIVIMVLCLTCCCVLSLARRIRGKGALEREKKAYAPEQTHTVTIRADSLLIASALFAATGLIAPVLLGSVGNLFLRILLLVYGLTMLWMAISNMFWRVQVQNDSLIWRDGYGHTHTYKFDEVAEAVPATRRQGFFRFRFTDGKELTIERNTPGLITLIRRCADRTGRGRMQYWND